MIYKARWIASVTVAIPDTLQSTIIGMSKNLLDTAAVLTKILFIYFTP